MLGENGNGKEGLVPRIVGDIISELTLAQENWRVICTAVEVYNEKIFDLLDGKQSLLKSQLEKTTRSRIYDISFETLAKEMSEHGCNSIEELRKKITGIEALRKKIAGNKSLELVCKCTEKIGS